MQLIGFKSLLPAILQLCCQQLSLVGDFGAISLGVGDRVEFSLEVLAAAIGAWIVLGGVVKALVHGDRLLGQPSELAQVAPERQVLVVGLPLMLFEARPSGVGRGALVARKLCLLKPFAFVVTHSVLCQRVDTEVN